MTAEGPRYRMYDCRESYFVAFLIGYDEISTVSICMAKSHRPIAVVRVVASVNA